MKKRLLLSAVALLLSGCGLFFRYHPYYYGHEVTMTLKKGVPCFGLADDEQMRNDQVKIYFAYIMGGGGEQPLNVMMGKRLDDITLQPEECIPYEGAELKINALYDMGFSVVIENKPSNEIHSYSGSFCLSENKNSKKVLHHFKRRERPTSCPVSNDE